MPKPLNQVDATPSKNERTKKNMRKPSYPTLVKAAETITHTELCQAPELPTLIALDATLQATMTLIEFNYPCPGDPDPENRDIADGVEEYIADSIFILANTLRRNLLAYYVAIQEHNDYPRDDQEISF